MKEVISKVLAFHKAFNLPKREEPAIIPESEYTLRHRLLREEVEEYLEACNSADQIKIADALGDILYVLLGTAIQHGLHDKLGAILSEIHDSNMSKLDENGQVISRADGKVLKGKNYFSPDIGKILDS